MSIIENTEKLFNGNLDLFATNDEDVELLGPLDTLLFDFITSTVSSNQKRKWGRYDEIRGCSSIKLFCPFFMSPA